MAREESFEMAEGATVEDLLNLIGERLKGISTKGFPENMVLLQNGNVTSRDRMVSDADEISILAPAMGG
jgi:molybdopterin converting factor small subunit